MNLFNWLLVGHMVGDWIFQNEWMALNKQRHLFTLPGMVHFTIYTVCIVAALYGSGFAHLDQQQYLLVILITFISHWLIDATDLARHWGRIVSQSDIAFVRLLVDQAFHILVLVLLIEYVI